MSDRPDLADMIAELTRPYTHREHYQVKRRRTWYGRDHITLHPPLIAQLWDSVDKHSTTADAGPRPGFGSQPAARLEAIDCAVRIDVEVARWLKDLGDDDPLDTVQAVQRLHGLVPSQPKVTVAAVTSDVRSWWVQARVVTGWDSPAWRPDSTCPLCGVRGGLRVRLESKFATCVECHEVWDEATIGLLADHIRAEAGSRRSSYPAPQPCGCQWPRPEGGHGLLLCPRCGWSSCWNAGQVSVSEQPSRRAS